MCGIFGIIALGQCLDSSDNAIVKKGVELLTHRGPDDCGIVAGDRICFGHTRLSIIDLAGGCQPMASYDKNGLISYNGEVYNFAAIKQELEKDGYRFNTRSDTEVVLNSFLKWGTECVDHFRGMFAFAAVDLKKKKVMLARDRLGKKPIFYLIRNKRLFFSSELEPLYRTCGPFKMNMESLDDYLWWQYIPAPKTIYRDVHSLPPAHLMEIDLKTGQIREKRYWHLSFKEDRSLSTEDWGCRLDEKIHEAVKIRLISDVPFGSFLSGGVDSSLVTGYMADILSQPVKTFTIGFKESDYSEVAYAEKIARINNAEFHSEIVEADSLGLLPLLVRHYGQPFADSSAIPTYYVSQMARKYVKMVLSGDGGDENFAGYNSYEYAIRDLEDKAAGFDRPVTDKNYFLKLAHYYYRKLKRWYWITKRAEDAYKSHYQSDAHFSPSDRRGLLKREYQNIVRNNAPYRRASFEIGNQPLVTKLQNVDLMTYLPYDILTKVDIASMANSLEVRSPLLDHHLVELAATMPAELKFREEKIDSKIIYIRKFILRQLAKRRYPAGIIDRSKMGFGVPLKIWFATKLKDEVRQRLVGSSYLPIFFNMKEIANLVESHSETFDCSAKLWNLIFLEEWMKSHRDSLSI